LTPEEIAWGITEVYLNDPPEESGKIGDDWSHEVRYYIGEVYTQSGMDKFPRIVEPIAEKEPARGAAPFSDDPIMFDTMWSHHREAVAAVEEDVKTRLQQMLAQLGDLPLSHGRFDPQAFRKATAPSGGRQR